MEPFNDQILTSLDNTSNSNSMIDTHQAVSPSSDVGNVLLSPIGYPQPYINLPTPPIFQQMLVTQADSPAEVSTPVFRAQVVPNKTAGCKCKRIKCLKLYCE
jgi:hypothetical protein